MLRANQRIIISNDAGDDVFGRVEEVGPVADLSAEVRDGLKEFGATRFAVISYHSSPVAQLMVTAVEIEGGWFDLDRRPLHIEVVGLHECGRASLR